MELLIILEGEGEDREGGMEGGEEGEGGRGGVLWWWNHTHELPTKREGLLAIWRTNYYNYPWGLFRTPHGMRQGEGLGNSSSPKPRYAHACARGRYESRDRMALHLLTKGRQRRTSRNGTAGMRAISNRSRSREYTLPHAPRMHADRDPAKVRNGNITTVSNNNLVHRVK